MKCSTTAAFGLMVGLWLVSPPALSSQPFHFEHQVSPLLAKVGCSAAECHGAASGKGGFKLSLFAENPRLDYETITRELDGRRLDYLNPSNSLFLKKPSRQGVKHGGGRLLRTGDLAYQDLLSWIARGGRYSEGPREDLVGLTVDASTAGVTVHARFRTETGEIVRDVTRLALLESNDEQVVTVDADGKVDRIGSGEAWILARYGKFSARLPLRQKFAESSPNDPARFNHPLDRVWIECLSRLGLRPGPSAPAETLLRRVTMDLAGRPPDLYELLKCQEMSPEKMLPETVDRLVQSADFDRVFAGHLADFFEVPPPALDTKNARSKNDRLRAMFLSALKEKASLATLSRRILSDADHQIAWKSYGDPRDRAEYIGRTMLGIRIGCARCHNHPLDRWTNSEHLAFAAYFSDPRPVAGGGMMAGKLFRPDAGREVEPKLLPLVELTPPAGLSREKEIAWFILDAGRRQFARNMANRIFGKLMGRPLVDLPDDHRLTNPARHEPILDLLTEVFLEMDTQLRPFVRFIVTSQLYALSSDPPRGGSVAGDPELEYLARRSARPLSATQFKQAVESVLGVEIDHAPPPESPLARQLYLLNSGLIQEGLGRPGNQVDAVFDFEPHAQAQLTALYRLILSRDPRPEERVAFLPLLQDDSTARASGRDLAFALMAGREFGTLR